MTKKTIFPFLTSLQTISELSTFQLMGSPIFIPKNHIKLKYSDHKRIKQKRRNKK